ncbi:MAG: hypothetical protein P8I56_09110 [Paracoccaceae bacterium]|nr:hypothetical protein [Paracoccaceae bacterium]
MTAEQNMVSNPSNDRFGEIVFISRKSSQAFRENRRPCAATAKGRFVRKPGLVGIKMLRIEPTAASSGRSRRIPAVLPTAA